MKPKAPVGYQLTSLAPLIRHFVGLHLTVETKDGKCYTGELKDADDYMNLVLSCTPSAKRKLSFFSDKHNGQVFTNIKHTHVKTEDQQPLNDLPTGMNEEYYRMVHIRGPSIRFVHFPDKTDLPALIRMGIKRKRDVQRKYVRNKLSKR